MVAPADRALATVKMHARVRLSRHARNEMRLYGISHDDVESVIASPTSRDHDDRGNARLSGETGDGRPILSSLLRTTATS
jgi:hypothetical protein